MSYRGRTKGSHGNQSHRNSGFFRSQKKQNFADQISEEKTRLEKEIANGEVGDMSYVHGRIDALTWVENKIPIDSK